MAAHDDAGARRDPDARGYLPLRRYSLIGDGHTAALIADDGAIDWLCLPAFDSDPLFARLLDARSAASSISPTPRAGIPRRRWASATWRGPQSSRPNLPSTLVAFW